MIKKQIQEVFDAILDETSIFCYNAPKIRTGRRRFCMSDLQNYLQKQLQDPVFAAEYEKLRPEYEAIRAIVGARAERNMTREDLAAVTGIRKSNIDRIENGTSSPTIDTLARLAAGLGKRLKIEFI